MRGITIDKNDYVWLTGKGSVSPGGAIAPGGHGRLVRFDPVNQDSTFVAVILVALLGVFIYLKRRDSTRF